MLLEMAIEAPTQPATAPEVLDLLVLDRAWVEAEFAAIMAASGLDDRVFVGTVPQPPPEPGRCRCVECPGWRILARPVSWALATRVRSPPGAS
jgi:hypothetical protein